MELSENGNLKMVKHLLKFGAQIDLKSADGKSALYSAWYNDEDDVVILLKRSGAKEDIKYFE